MFDSASNLLQDPASLVGCLGSKEHLAKSKSNPNQLHHIKLNRIHWSFSNHHHIPIHYQISSSLHFLILFLQKHNPVLVVVDIHEGTPPTKTSVCAGLSLNCLSHKIQKTSANTSLFICYFLLFSDFVELEFSSQ